MLANIPFQEIYNQVPLQRYLILHDVVYIAAVIEAEYKSEFQQTKDTGRAMGCLLWEFWRPRYNCTTLYSGTECYVMLYIKHNMVCCSTLCIPFGCIMWYYGGLLIIPISYFMVGHVRQNI